MLCCVREFPSCRVASLPMHWRVFSISLSIEDRFRNGHLEIEFVLQIFFRVVTPTFS